MIEQAVKNGDATKGNAQAVAFTAMKPMLFVEPPKANDAVLFYKSGTWHRRRSHTFVNGGDGL